MPDKYDACALIISEELLEKIRTQSQRGHTSAEINVTRESKKWGIAAQEAVIVAERIYRQMDGYGWRLEIQRGPECRMVARWAKQ